MLHLAAVLQPTRIHLLGDFQLAAASNDVVLSQFVLAGQGGHTGGSRALKLCVALDRGFHCSQGGQVCVSCPCIRLAYCGWFSFGWVGCRLCQKAMITFPQWRAALGGLAYGAGFGSVLFYNPCTSSEP